MGTRTTILGVVAALVLGTPATAMDTAFSYQGRLNDAGSPANGDYDFQFSIFNAEIGGSQVGSNLYGEDVQVAEGFFTIYLDFGAGVFDGTALWLEIQVRDGSATGSYTPLAPRQAVLPSPYSLHAGKVSWGDVEDMPSGFADGTDDDTTYLPGNQLDLAADTFNVVEGSGSGLDADSIDGLDSSEFAPTAHTHFEAGNGLDLAGGILSVDPTDFNGSSPVGESLGGVAAPSVPDEWVLMDEMSWTAPSNGRVLIIGTGLWSCTTGCGEFNPGTCNANFGLGGAHTGGGTWEEFKENNETVRFHFFHIMLVAGGSEYPFELWAKKSAASGPGTEFSVVGQLVYVFIPN